jgi:hypothetical protein
MASHFLELENTGRRKELEGCLMCSKFPSECRSGFEDQNLAKHLPAVAFQEYLTARVETLRAQMQC